MAGNDVLHRGATRKSLRRGKGPLSSKGFNADASLKKGDVNRHAKVRGVVDLSDQCQAMFKVMALQFWNEAPTPKVQLQRRRAQQQNVEDSKSDVGWGSQIRSYVLDQSRIKDLRTSFETGNTQAVLDGDLDGFLEQSLKSGL